HRHGGAGGLGRTRGGPPPAPAGHQHQRLHRRGRLPSAGRSHLPPLLQHGGGSGRAGLCRRGSAAGGAAMKLEDAPAVESATPPLVVRVRRVEGAPVVAVRLWLRAGARQEPIPGQSLVTGRMLTEGTPRRDWRRIAEEAEAKGMIVQSSGSFESIGLAIDALAQDWELALDWAAELLLESSFPEDRCAWLARQAAAEPES